MVRSQGETDERRPDHRHIGKTKRRERGDDPLLPAPPFAARTVEAAWRLSSVFIGYSETGTVYQKSADSRIHTGRD